MRFSILGAKAAKLCFGNTWWKLLHRHNNIIGDDLPATIHKAAADQQSRQCRRTINCSSLIEGIRKYGSNGVLFSGRHSHQVAEPPRFSGRHNLGITQTHSSGARRSPKAGRGVNPGKIWSSR